MTPWALEGLSPLYSNLVVSITISNNCLTIFNDDEPEKQLIFTEKSGSTANCHELRMHTLGTTLNCSWCVIGQYLPSFITLTNDVYALSKLTVSIFTWLYVAPDVRTFQVLLTVLHRITK